MTGAPFTKGQVNRAGILLLNLRELVARDGFEQAVDELGEDVLDQAWQALAWWRSLYSSPLSTVAASLRYHVDRESGRLNERIEVTQRLKRLDTLVGKLAREPGSVTRMHDIGGVRAVLPTLRHLYAVRRRLLKSWSITKERDYIAKPKDSGYRALHLIVRRGGLPIEVQLRTVGQDAWANVVEETGREHGVDLKFGAGSARIHGVLLTMSDLIARFDRDELSAEQLRRELKELSSLTLDETIDSGLANEPD